MTDDDPAPEILAHVDLVARGRASRGRPTAEQVLAGMALDMPLLPGAPRGRPEPIRSRVADAGTQLVGLICAVRLDPLPSGRRYGPLVVEVALPPTCRVVALPDAAPGGAELYGSRVCQTFEVGERRTFARTRSWRCRPAPWSSRASWPAASRSGAVTSGRCAVVALSTAKATAFRAHVPAGRAVRLVVALDMKGYSGPTPPAPSAPRTGWGRWWTGPVPVHRRRGRGPAGAGGRADGVFPPGIDRARCCGPSTTSSARLREVNLDLGEAAAVRLRVGVDRGLTRRRATGWTGPGPITAGRLRTARSRVTRLMRSRRPRSSSSCPSRCSATCSATAAASRTRRRSPGSTWACREGVRGHRVAARRRRRGLTHRRAVRPAGPRRARGYAGSRSRDRVVAHGREHPLDRRLGRPDERGQLRLGERHSTSTPFPRRTPWAAANSRSTRATRTAAGHVAKSTRRRVAERSLAAIARATAAAASG